MISVIIIYLLYKTYKIKIHKYVLNINRKIKIKNNV
jgi:hypothetical protein